ncbi:MAG: Shikimate dehydrogenase (NADP(+)) [Alphaproteobacteria bacterium MarineAlpha9_Bin4]|nr:shikimate dehydrogenase [Pelagibacterales bacterium]PPR25129.1 MAG: Shikimate dehydrogenase (NADP(+)) [Alphaproteobacteria bacterium MarineAlpha9_Bin4]|tara:strand:- start:1724 stop:2551 length:828 start_codon:yes stop_codon:yes gene_type:complete
MKKYYYSLLGIIGNPLKQSMSPILHNYWIKKNKLDYHYSKFQLDSIKNIDKSIKGLNIKGLNVTIPYKKKIINYLDKLDKISSKLQAVNTIKNNNGTLEGYNTDVEGFSSGLRELNNINTKKPAVIYGAGGACEAIIYSLIKEGFNEIFIINRTKSKAEKMAEKYNNVIVKNWKQKDVIRDAGIIVNSTSLGMIGYPDVPISLKEVDKNTKIYDIVYNPTETGLIKEAKKNKLDYVTGLPMFIGQAQESFKVWFNIKPKINNYLIKKIKSKIKTT